MAGSTSRLLVPDTPIGRFRIRRALGRWRIGTAYEASDPATGEASCVLTLDLKPGFGRRYAEWVELETSRCLGLDDAHMAPMDGGLIDRRLAWMALPPFRGRSLLQVTRADGPLGERRAARLGRALAQIVSVAHGKGVHLGGLRPTTVLLDSDPDHPDQPRIFDLGLERGLAEMLLRPPKAAPAYHAPDRPLGRRPRAPDDIYAIGALVYYMIVGKRPAQGAADKVASPPSWGLPEDSEAAYLDPIVLKAMAPRARERHPNAAALAESLAALAEVFALSEEAREMLGMPEPGRQSPFTRARTHPHLLHDMLGIPHTVEREPDTIDIEPPDDES